MADRQSVEMPTAPLGEGCLEVAIERLDSKFLEDLQPDDRAMINVLPNFSEFFRPVGNRVTRIQCQRCPAECFMVVEPAEQINPHRTGEFVCFVLSSSGVETDYIYNDVCIEGKGISREVSEEDSNEERRITRAIIEFMYPSVDISQVVDLDAIESKIPTSPEDFMKRLVALTERLEAQAR